MNDWWWPGFLIQFVLFLGALIGFVWWFTKWSTQHVDRHLNEIEEERLQKEERQHEEEE